MATVFGARVPDFTAQSTVGDIAFADFVTGSWALLYSFSKVRARAEAQQRQRYRSTADPTAPTPSEPGLRQLFDPVATTELGMLAKLHAEFSARDCKVLALSGGHGEQAGPCSRPPGAAAGRFAEPI